MHTFMKGLVQHPYFEYTICVLIVTNALTIGIQTEILAIQSSRGIMQTPPLLRAFETIFCTCFTTELVLRLYVYRLSFFYQKNWNPWNIFDLLVVSLQLVDELVKALDIQGLSLNFSFMRVVRIIRLVRIFRLMRLMRHIRDLRTLVISMGSSFKSLVWTIILLLLLMYTISLWITQMVSEVRSGNVKGTVHIDTSTDAQLVLYYGGVFTTMLSLFEAITGGQDWDNMLKPLVKVHAIWALLFPLYIVFSVFALMNVATGVFIESVVETNKKEKDIFLINNVREMFQGLKDGIRSTLDWEMFQDLLPMPQMQEAFKAINVDPSEADGLFSLFDLDNSGEVNAEEFLSGCLRLRGPAKALDLALLIKQVRQVEKTNLCLREAIGSVVGLSAANESSQHLISQGLDSNI